MRILTLFIIIHLFINLHASVLSEKNILFLNSLTKKEEAVVIVMLKNRIGHQLKKKLLNNSDSSKKNMSRLFIVAGDSSLLLSKLTVKNPVLSELLDKEFIKFIEMSSLDNRFKTLSKEQNELHNKIIKYFTKISSVEQKSIYSKNKHNIDSSYFEIINYLLLSDSEKKKKNLNTKALKIQKTMQRIISQQGGSIKLNDGTVEIVNVLAIDNKVIYYIEYITDKILKKIADRDGTFYDELSTLEYLKGKKFKNDINNIQSKYFTNTYCKDKALNNELKSGLEIEAIIYLTDRTPITKINISKSTCEKN